LTLKQRQQLIAGMRPTTIFDFFYRLRLRSNYEDADAFILGTMTQGVAEDFNRALCDLTSCTLFLLELHIAARIGASMASFIGEFTKADKVGYSAKTIGARKLFLT